MESELDYLIGKYFGNACSREELTRLIELAAEDSDRLSEALRSKWDEMLLDGEEYREYRTVLSDRILKDAEAPVRYMHRKGRIYRAAVAAAVIVVGFGVVWIFRSGIGKGPTPLARAATVATHGQPGGNRATLTLNDGSAINLASASNGTLAQQGDVKVRKVGEGIAYTPSGMKAAVGYNIVSTPRGGEYQVELADGTKVWLNAASSLRYPTAFIGNERIVELTGEAYFEVKHDAAKPFHVKVKNGDIEDLGTEFDINAYDDESFVTTTVVNGSVSFDPADDKRIFHLSAGEQAIAGVRDINVNRAADLDAVTAWKEGNFIFNGTSLGEIMKQIARWYDLQVQFEGPYQDRTFSGIVSRKSPLSEVLDIMRNAQIKFQQEGNTLVVRQ